MNYDPAIHGDAQYKALGYSYMPERIPQMRQTDIIAILLGALHEQFKKDGNEMSDKNFKTLRRYAQHACRALCKKAVIYPSDASGK